MFDEKRAQEPIDFIQQLHLVGDFVGKPFTLQPWQQEILWNLYGTVNEQGARKYQNLYLEVPKKNGKTPLVAAIGLYHLVCDPAGGEIYCAAAEKDQAAQTYRYMKLMIEQDPYLSAALRVVDSKKEIHNPKTGTFVKVLSAEAYSKHGMAPSVVIIDELHAHQKRDLWDFLTFGSGAARKQPLWLTITTAGDDPDRHTIGWEVHEYARRVRDGELVDPSWYVKIYGAPDNADIYDEAVWHESNPSLGVTISIESVRQEALKARNSEPSERLFRWLRLNQWVALKRVGWLPITMWDATVCEWDPMVDMLGKRCYMGLDLAAKVDLTGVALLFPPQEGVPDWRFFIEAWIPEDGMKERIARDHAPYESFVKEKHLSTTPGGVVDYQFISARIGQLSKLFKVQYYCGDPWHLEVLRQHFSRDLASKFIEIPQTLAGMSPGTGELERLFRAKQISHQVNPLGRWCFGNVRVHADGNANIKPLKDKSIDKIDPIVALINAMAAAIRLEVKKSVYEDRGIRVV